MSVRTWWQRRCGGFAPAGYGSPVVISELPVLSVRYGLHWLHAPPGGGVCLRVDATWRNISGILVNTSRGAVWLYFRRWAA